MAFGSLLLAALIEMLGSDDIGKREWASAALLRLGQAALTPLQQATRSPDPEIAARARDACEIIGLRLLVEDRSLADIDLHALSICVQRLSRKTILWREDLGLARIRAHVLSDLPLGSEPGLLFSVHLSTLEANGLIAISAGDPAQETYTIKPSPERGMQPLSKPRKVIRVFALRQSRQDGLAEALTRAASFPGLIRWRDPENALIVSEFEWNLQRVEETVAKYSQ